MEIVDIFDDRLFSFAYNGQENEFDRLMEIWTDIEYLRNFATENHVDDVDKFVEERSRDVEEVQDLLDDLVENDLSLEGYFRPYHDSEVGVKILSLQKGKTSRNKNKLRIYAIKIDSDCFVVTGGAIKMSQSTQDHPDTDKEISKLKIAKEFLTDVTHEKLNISFFEVL